MDLLVTSVIHPGVEDPVDLGWLESGESYQPSRVVDRLQSTVHDLAPRAEFEPLVDGSRLPHGAVAKRIRRLARDRDAAVVFVGSDNAGRLFTPISSVGGGVATERAYDVYIVRRQESEL